MSSGMTAQPGAWRRLLRSRAASGAGVFLVLLLLACLMGPLLSPHAPDDQDRILGAVGPSAGHWFGTDYLGRDLLTRTLVGGRISLAVGLIATSVALLIGVVYGAVAGYVGGRLDRVMMRLVDSLYALPFPIFVILLVTLLGRHLWLVFFAIGFVEWLTLARIVRGQVRSLRHAEFVEAARSLGASTPRIVIRHLLPNLAGTVVVYATLMVPNVILLEAFLSFLGLGTAEVSWGLLIDYGAKHFEEAPWLLVVPALALASTLLCLNLLGDGLRDALDPSSAGES